MKNSKFENYVFDCFQNATDFEFLKSYTVSLCHFSEVFSEVSFGSFFGVFSEVFGSFFRKFSDFKKVSFLCSKSSSSSSSCSNFETKHRFAAHVDQMQSPKLPVGHAVPI